MIYPLSIGIFFALAVCVAPYDEKEQPVKQPIGFRRQTLTTEHRAERERDAILLWKHTKKCKGKLCVRSGHCSGALSLLRAARAAFCCAPAYRRTRGGKAVYGIMALSVAEVDRVYHKDSVL